MEVFSVVRKSVTLAVGQVLLALSQPVLYVDTSVLTPGPQEASKWAGLCLAATLQCKQGSHFWLHFQRGSLSCWEIQMGEKVIPIKEDYTVSMIFASLFTF